MFHANESMIFFLPRIRTLNRPKVMETRIQTYWACHRRISEEIVAVVYHQKVVHRNWIHMKKSMRIKNKMTTKPHPKDRMNRKNRSMNESSTQTIPKMIMIARQRWLKIKCCDAKVLHRLFTALSQSK